MTKAIARASLGAALGQPARGMERIELNCLSAELRTDAERRATAGNATRGVMKTITLNTLQIRLPATEVIAPDVLTPTVAYRAPDGALRSARCTLASLTVVE